MTYAKTFIPLESDPSIFTSLLHNLGGSRDLQFIDVWSLDDPDQLALIPRPVLAFVLILPTSAEHETKKAEQEAERKERGESGNSGDVVFLQQTIHNACGLYAILHAACNTQRADAIEPGSLLSELLAVPRTEFLESSQALEAAYNAAAQQGSTRAPDAEEEVDFHYVSFVMGRDASLFELDGDLEGPFRRDEFRRDGRESLFVIGLDAVREYVKSEGRGDLGFSLMALVRSDGV